MDVRPAAAVSKVDDLLAAVLDGIDPDDVPAAWEQPDAVDPRPPLSDHLLVCW